MNCLGVYLVEEQINDAYQFFHFTQYLVVAFQGRKTMYYITKQASVLHKTPHQCERYFNQMLLLHHKRKILSQFATNLSSQKFLFNANFWENFLQKISTSPTRHKLFFSGHVLRVEKLGGQVEPRLRPLHVEVQGEGDAVVFVVDLQHVGYLYA